MDQVIAMRGKPTRTLGNIYYWKNAAGGTDEIETDATGTVIDIDVTAGEHEIREVQLPSSSPQTSAVLGQSGHMNYVPPPGSVQSYHCDEVGMRGKPCESFTLPGGATLIVNFGHDTGLADGSLSEILLAAPVIFAGTSEASPPPPLSRRKIAGRPLTQLNVDLEVSGCGAQAIRKGPIAISVWPAKAYPGFGDEVANAQTRNKAIFHLPPGYYRFMIGGQGCWEAMQWLAILPGLSRKATLRFESFNAKPGVDYDIWYSRSGGVAGRIPREPIRVTVEPASTHATSDFPHVLVQSGAYYADRVPEGSYKVHAVLHGVSIIKSVVVKQDEMKEVDFSARDFRSKRSK